MLRTRVITPSKHEECEFISGIFTCQKNDGTYRMILNLKEFKKNVECKKIKMESLKSALNLVTKNCWMASIDLVSAYYCVPTAREHRKYLKFLWQGQLYEYTCYSNGFVQCPRCFTKITKPIYAYLQTSGHSLTGYLDDSLLLAVEYNDCAKTIADAISTFDKLDFVVHPSKSVLSPTQEITCLRFIIISKEMAVRFTGKRKLAVSECCVTISSNRKNKIRDIARLLDQ